MDNGLLIAIFSLSYGYGTRNLDNGDLLVGNNEFSKLITLRISLLSTQ